MQTVSANPRGPWQSMKSSTHSRRSNSRRTIPVALVEIFRPTWDNIPLAAWSRAASTKLRMSAASSRSASDSRCLCTDSTFFVSVAQSCVSSSGSVANSNRVDFFRNVSRTLPVGQFRGLATMTLARSSSSELSGLHTSSRKITSRHRRLARSNLIA